MSSSSTTTAKLNSSLSAEAIETYLQTEKEFFVGREELLEELILPHARRGTISLVERQVEILRGKNKVLEHKLLDLLKVARENEELSSHLHNLALGLLDSQGLDDVVASAREQLLQAFKADFVTISLFPRSAEDTSLHYADSNDVKKHFNDSFDSRRLQCGGMSEEQMNALFGELNGQVVSAVLVPLVDAEPVGFIAMGSREKARFHPGMGTLFLGYLGELVTQAITYCQRVDAEG
jgi:uncharacterized protein YigA (DUF484 family)